MNSESQSLVPATRQAESVELTVEQVRKNLSVTEKGQPANTIGNCRTVFCQDPLLRGAIRLNLLTDRIDIVRDLGWRRSTSALTDTDVKYLLLYFEQNYGLTSEKKLMAALSIVANENCYHPICQTYNRLGKNACTSHKIEARDLYNLVLKDIQELAAMALKDADAFYQRLSSRMERRYMADASEMQKERERLEARNRQIDDMFLSLYTDKAKGVISEQRFVKLTAAMEQEQEENQRCLQELMRMLQQSDAQESEVRTFIREIRQYATIQELDETVLNRLISRILVGEVKKVDGQKVQEVRIVYNFVGEIFM